MFTPQKKFFPNLPLTPNINSGEKLVFSPNLDSFDGGGGVELMEQSLFDRDGLVQKISKLENELYDYQHTMGLLLIEKKEWTSTYEEYREALAEVQETLKREQGSYSISLSDIEKQEENLRKAWEVEKQCVANIEMAIHDISAESEEMMLISDKKMAEAHGRVTSTNQKSLTVEGKLLAADAQLAEVSRKSSEMERKLKEVEANESILQSEWKLFDTEKERNEAALFKQREELRDWENSLQEREGRQAEGCRSLNQREERSRESCNSLQQKEKDLEEPQRKNKVITLQLKSKEDDVNIRFAKLAKEEEEAHALEKNLEMKKKDLLSLKEKLVRRERVEIQKLDDEHNATLDFKWHRCELEMEQKSNFFDEELKKKAVAVELKEVQLIQEEEKISNTEQALEKSVNRYEEKERGLELEWKILRERKKSLQIAAKKLELEKKNIFSDKEELSLYIDELDKKRGDIDEKQRQLRKELEKLEVTKVESEIQCLESELTQEQGKCKLQEELLLKELETLKQEKERFEREWEVLDEKKVDITCMLKQVNEEKNKIEKLKLHNEESLKNQNLVAQNHIRQKMEDLRLKKEAFEASMEHERLVLSEKTQNEQHDMLHDFELQKRNLELDIQNKFGKMEKSILDREKALTEEREQELHSIKHSREETSRAMKEMSLERLIVEKESEEVATRKKYLQGQQLELRKDIDKLNVLSKKLTDQSEGYKEFFEKQNNCKKCEVDIHDFASDLEYVQEMMNSKASPKPSLSEGYSIGSMKENIVGSERLAKTLSPGGAGSSASGGRDFSLHKCTPKILSSSPLRRIEDSVAQGEAKELPLFNVQHNLENVKGYCENEAGPSSRIPRISLDVQKVRWADNNRVIEGQCSPFGNEHSKMDLKVPEVPEVSMNSQSSAQGKHGTYQRCRIRGRNSVKAVVEDAKKVMRGENPELTEGKQPSGPTVVSAGISGASRGDSFLVDEGPASVSLKPHSYASEITTSEQDLDGSEAHSKSVRGAIGSRKRRQTANQGSQVPVENRYNLRRRKT
ncbi:hypothetical protein IFM89_031273 [Coptis chinensis]|uniref:Nuclear matrix constituent protein 1-like protein n=1 Tax=Coptis chinensis TaxID=261450 RepID=A0A835IXY5_9MAGN|nr:hypothetical protein IFM89_031273 [Coptis chinensis]